MNSEASSYSTALTETTIIANSGAADLHEKSFLELMDSIDGGDNTEFNPPIANIILKPAVFD